MMTEDKTYDCVVIGGGPAGATAATLLADFGHRVVVLERSRFPRFHIGESLIPETYWTFKRLGLLEKLNVSPFPRKEGVQFVSGSGKEVQPFYFTDRDPHEFSITWQVRRDTFDAMLLDNAREHGAEVRHEVAVREVLFDGPRATGVRAFAGGRIEEIGAQVVVDATGQAALLSRQLGIRRPEPNLKKGTVYAHFKGAHRDTGRDEGATIIVYAPNGKGWLWYIPLPEDVVSVGVVGSPADLFAGRGDNVTAILEAHIARCPNVRERLVRAERVSPVYVIRDFSYRADRVAGDGWVLAGDAFGFLDPVFSSGVMLALKGGQFAADAIHDGLESGDLSAGQLGRFGPELAAGMQRFRQLIYAFYDPDFSFPKFLTAHPQYKDHLIRLLIGDVFKDDVAEIFKPMGQMCNLPEPMPLADGGTPIS